MNVNGLRVFLLTVLSLMANGQEITCAEIERLLPLGVATALYNQYPVVQQYLSADSLSPVDDYYKQWGGCAEGVELGKYLCAQNNGLQLLIALALNEIY